MIAKETTNSLAPPQTIAKAYNQLKVYLVSSFFIHGATNLEPYLHLKNMSVRELITRYQNDRQNFDAKGYPDSIPLISPDIAIIQAANKDQKIYILLVLGFSFSILSLTLNYFF